MNPKVSVVIPTLGREVQLARCVQLVHENACYPNYELVVERDHFGPSRQGVTKTLKKGVERSTGELVLFLGNDCEPQPFFMVNAVEKLLDTWPDACGLVGLNDGFWKGKLATHWLASKSLLPLIDGEFFHTGYHHVACDNELTERCKKLCRYVYCPEAMVKHAPPLERLTAMDEVSKLGRGASTVFADRALWAERKKLLGLG